MCNFHRILLIKVGYILNNDVDLVCFHRDGKIKMKLRMRIVNQ